MPALVESNVMATHEDDDDYDAEVKAKAEVMKKAQARANEKAKVAAAERAAKEAAKLEAEERAKEEEARQWAEAKEAAAVRAAETAKKEAARQQKLAAMSPTESVLFAIEELAARAVENDKHAERVGRLEKVLGPQADSMREKARRKSKDLQEEIAKLLDGKLEAAFKQFDKDESGALDLEELQLAYAEAGMQISDAKLAKCIKLLDTNGDGVIDLEEFKQIAVKMQMVG